jgi:lysyl-tRNA synthetase class II
MNKRVMGKLSFLTLRDDRGQIQVHADGAALSSNIAYK